MSSVRAVKRKVARRKHHDDLDLELGEDRHKVYHKQDQGEGFLQKYLSRSLQNLDELYALDDDGDVDLDDGSVTSLPLTATTMTDNEQSDYDHDFSETRYQPPVAQVLPNNNQLDGDLPDDQFDQSDPIRLGGSPNIIDIGGGPTTKERLSPRGRSGDGREDVVAFHDGPHGDGPKILNHGAEDQFEALDLEYTLNQTDFIPNATLMEVKDPRIPAGKEDSTQYSPIPAHHSQSVYQQRKSPVHLRRHPQYSTAYDATQHTQPFQSNLHDYPQYPDYPTMDPVARTTGYPVPHHTKMNLSQWQHNLDSQLKLQQQMQHLQLNPAGHPSSISGGGLGLHRHAAGAVYTLGDPNVGLGVVSTDTTNMEGLIRAKENMLHERNIIIERQKLEIAHLQKQNEEQEAIARQRMFARSREDGDMLFLKMQEYQYEIASLKAQLAEVSTARIAEGDQLNRKLGQAQEAMKASQHTNEKTIADLKKQLRHRESEVGSSRTQAEMSKRDYDKLKKKIGKMERYMHDLPTADEYRESTETIRSLHQKEAVMEERVASLESALAKAKQKALKSKMEASSLEEQKNELQLQIERMKREMGKLQSALGSKETGDPTDLELCSRDQLAQMREENEKHSSSVEHLKKVIESKHKHLQKVKGEHQRALQEVESRLLQEEGVITALRLEVKDKERSMEEMSRSMKELASQSQELYDHNLSLQESVRTLELKASSDKARLTGQLVKELTRCVQDLQQLVELCSQRAEGREPNVSLLLGFRPSSAMSYEPGDDDDTPTSETVIKARLSQVQKLREDIDLLRSLISDKYAEDVGSNCITQ
ncbi:centrosomal protein of 85 kDa-like [Diadema antillarum]|uniref:centrosomal protein of 85 kDa-like n=1 Tax=Diadema antillarum TaxID=105358 RepID=UPI003A896AD0